MNSHHPHNRRERMQLKAARKNKFVKDKDAKNGRRATIEEKEAEDDIREEVH